MSDYLQHFLQQQMNLGLLVMKEIHNIGQEKNNFIWFPRTKFLASLIEMLTSRHITKLPFLILIKVP